MTTWDNETDVIVAGCCVLVAIFRRFGFDEMIVSESDILDRAVTLDESITQSELRLVEGCSHALLMEDPAEVERHVRGWLDEQAAALGAPVATETQPATTAAAS